MSRSCSAPHSPVCFMVRLFSRQTQTIYPEHRPTEGPTSGTFCLFSRVSLAVSPFVSVWMYRNSEKPWPQPGCALWIAAVLRHWLGHGIAAVVVAAYYVGSSSSSSSSSSISGGWSKRWSATGAGVEGGPYGKRRVYVPSTQDVNRVL